MQLLSPALHSRDRPTSEDVIVSLRWARRVRCVHAVGGSDTRANRQPSSDLPSHTT
eukprot:COSAG01_NODE_39093_length_481_cov_0.816754_1_plen_55_part_01